MFSHLFLFSFFPFLFYFVNHISGVTPASSGGLERSYMMLAIKPRAVLCKSSAYTS